MKKIPAGPGQLLFDGGVEVPLESVHDEECRRLPAPRVHVDDDGPSQRSDAVMLRNIPAPQTVAH